LAHPQVFGLFPESGTKSANTCRFRPSPCQSTIAAPLLGWERFALNSIFQLENGYSQAVPGLGTLAASHLDARCITIKDGISSKKTKTQ
jgi:hypothetical protein